MNNNSKIDEVIAKADIASVIGNYVKLKKEGSDYKGLCPFHNDNNPSLSVSPRKHCYKCFSCGAKGNVITFIQNYKHVTFGEALREVAQTCGVEIETRVNPNEVRASKLHKIMDEACELYEFYLTNTTEGKEALEYLHNRNMDDDIIKRFRIGLSSVTGNIVTKALIESGKYLPLDLVDAGLVASDQTKTRYFDLFRGRIMFPILDYRGNVIAFSGRIYNTESNSKYMNSHEGFLFKKSNVLYNYFHASNDIELNDCVIIFEGFMDVIAAYKAGVKNTVCSMGTSLTLDQVKVITKLTKNIILCYDGDTPGIEASKRAIKLFLDAKATVRNVILPYGLDPDDYLNKYGKDALKKLLLIDNVLAIDYLYEISKRKLNLNDASTIDVFVKEIADLFKIYNSKILEQITIKKMANDLGIDIKTVEEELKKYTISNQNNDTYNVNSCYTNEFDDLTPPPINDYGYEVPPIEYENAGYTDVIDDNVNTVKTASRVIQKYEIAEERLIYIALIDKEKANQIRRRLDDGEYVLKINRDILYKIYKYYNENEHMIKESFETRLNDEEKAQLDKIYNSLNPIFGLTGDDDTSYLQLLAGLDSNIECVKKVKYQKTLDDFGETNLDNYEQKRLLKKQLLKKKN